MEKGKALPPFQPPPQPSSSQEDASDSPPRRTFVSTTRSIGAFSAADTSNFHKNAPQKCQVCQIDHRLFHQRHNLQEKRVLPPTIRPLVGACDSKKARISELNAGILNPNPRANRTQRMEHKGVEIIDLEMEDCEDVQPLEDGDAGKNKNVEEPADLEGPVKQVDEKLQSFEKCKNGGPSGNAPDQCGKYTIFAAGTSKKGTQKSIIVDEDSVDGMGKKGVLADQYRKNEIIDVEVEEEAAEVGGSRVGKEGYEKAKTVKLGFLKDLLDTLKVLVAEKKGSSEPMEKVDILKTAVQKGVKFPRPRWWPPERKFSFSPDA